MLELLEQNGLNEKIKNNIQFQILGLYGQTLHQPKPFICNGLHFNQFFNLGTLQNFKPTTPYFTMKFQIPKVLTHHPPFPIQIDGSSILPTSYRWYSRVLSLFKKYFFNKIKNY